MLDPASIATAVSLSTAAFNNIKKAFAMGRDIEQMGGDLAVWCKGLGRFVEDGGYYS